LLLVSTLLLLQNLFKKLQCIAHPPLNQSFCVVCINLNIFDIITAGNAA